MEFAPYLFTPLWVPPYYPPDAFNYKWSLSSELVNRSDATQDWLPGIYATCVHTNNTNHPNAPTRAAARADAPATAAHAHPTLTPPTLTGVGTLPRR